MSSSMILTAVREEYEIDTVGGRPRDEKGHYFQRRRGGRYLAFERWVLIMARLHIEVDEMLLVAYSLMV
jgi:hypothetical protein